jgi:cytochrome c oxidase subunit 6b
MHQIEIKTAPADFRFPTTNQSRHCFTRYVEFHRYICCYNFTIYLCKVCSTFPKYLKCHEIRCVSAKGDDAADCEKFAKYYRSLCPAEWVSDFASCDYPVKCSTAIIAITFQCKGYTLKFDFKQCGLSFL